MERFSVKKNCYRSNFSAVYLIFTGRITFRFEITIKRLYVRFVHKQKVTKMGSIIGHKIDCKGVRVLIGQQYIPSEN